MRYGGREDPAAAREALKAWMQAQPSGVEGRRQMPQFNLTDQELDDLVDFLEWTSTHQHARLAAEQGRLNTRA